MGNFEETFNILEMKFLAGQLSFHTFAMADGPLTYLSSNRDSSRRLAKYIRKKLGDLGTRSKIKFGNI